MTHIAFVADECAEVICGGRRGSGINVSQFKYSTVTTNFGQSNQVSNLGVGLLAGYGNAQSIQANEAGIFTLVG